MEERGGEGRGQRGGKGGERRGREKGRDRRMFWHFELLRGLKHKSET